MALSLDKHACFKMVMIVNKLNKIKFIINPLVPNAPKIETFGQNLNFKLRSDYRKNSSCNFECFDELKYFG